MKRVKTIQFVINKESKLKNKDVESEDSGCFKAVFFYPAGESEDNDQGLYIKLGSWYDDKTHPEFASFVGKKITITLEVE